MIEKRLLMKKNHNEEIRQLKIFKDLAPQQWSRIYPLIKKVSVIEGEDLIREGSRAESFYIVLSGHYMIHYRNGKAVTLNGKGDVIGWSSVVTLYTYTASVTALSDGEVLRIAGAEFLKLIQTDSMLGKKMLEKINEVVSSRPYTGLLP
jgi:CRP-like cAMP-binding protein